MCLHHTYKICPHHAHALVHIIITLLIIHADKNVHIMPEAMSTFCSSKLGPHCAHSSVLFMLFNKVCILLAEYV